jgi:hypothetical protein
MPGANGLEDGDPRHGTPNGYGNHGCRCDRCREANRVQHRLYMAQVRAEGRALGRHGSELRYDTGCRCDQCREAHNAKSRKFKARQRRLAS